MVLCRKVIAPIFALPSRKTLFFERDIGTRKLRVFPPKPARKFSAKKPFWVLVQQEKATVTLSSVSTKIAWPSGQ
jgi:hypothetical protein